MFTPMNHPPTIPNEHKFGWDPNQSPTANLEAGTTGLWRISKRMCLQSLAWKLLVDLETEKVGTNEVESEAANIS